MLGLLLLIKTKQLPRVNCLDSAVISINAAKRTYHVPFLLLKAIALCPLPNTHYHLPVAPCLLSLAQCSCPFSYVYCLISPISTAQCILSQAHRFRFTSLFLFAGALGQSILYCIYLCVSNWLIISHLQV